MTDKSIGKGTTTLDYLRNVHPWLARKLDDLEHRAEAAEAECERLRTIIYDADRALTFRRVTQPKAELFYESPDAEYQLTKDLGRRIDGALNILRAALNKETNDGRE